MRQRREHQCYSLFFKYPELTNTEISEKFDIPYSSVCKWRHILNDMKHSSKSKYLAIEASYAEPPSKEEQISNRWMVFFGVLIGMFIMLIFVGIDRSI